MERNMELVVRHHPESIMHALLKPTGGAGVYARTALFEGVIEGLSALISKLREPDTEILRFPPIMSRQMLESSGYLHSFPHLLGCVSCLDGTETEIRTLVEKHVIWSSHRRLATPSIHFRPR
jgi:hypothetical protein